MSRHVVMVDPELVLPSDPVPQVGEIVVLAEWAPGLPGRFGGIGELIACRTGYERAASVMISTAQAGIVPPAFVTYGLPLVRAEVYGQVFGPDEMYRRETEAGVDHGHADRFRQRLADAEKRGWLYGWWFSQIEPEGSWRAVHRHRLARQMLSGEYHAMRARLGAPEPGSRFAEGAVSTPEPTP